MRTFRFRFCFCLIQLVSINAIAQIRIVDQTDKQPIAFVRFITEDGKLAASSDINGIVDTSFVAQKVKSGQNTLSLSHASYQTKELTLAYLRELSLIELKPRIVDLPEISIESSTKDKRIRILKGYFRSYMLEEGIPKFYTDGICEYYLSSEGKTLGVRLINYRTFRNQELLKNEKRNGFRITFRVNSVPSLPIGAQFIDRIGKSYAFITTLGGIDIYRGRAKAGIIRAIAGTDVVQTSMNHLAPDTNKNYSVFGVSFETTQEDRSQRYHSTTLDDLRYEFLESHTDIIRFGFTYPDESEIHSTAIHEFYVYDIRIVPKSCLKGVKYTGNSLQYSHSYSYPYWEDLSKHHIPALSKSVADALGKTLTPY
jgi:hypothetical protein